MHGAANAATGNTFGVYGESASSAGRGVFGYATSSTGVAYGVYGLSGSATGVYGSGAGIGVHGEGYDGVWGEANGAAGYGVFGDACDTDGIGVLGIASASSGSATGGVFQSYSVGGIGVLGRAQAGTGITYGVYGQTYSSSEPASGVYGVASAGAGVTYGGRFDSNSTSGRAVSGYAGAASGPTYGVLGQSISPSGYGVYCGGRFAASGTKAFRIDHPDNPANKYLLHYASEAPEPQNFYNGVVVLDGAGHAVVELPRYFAKINKDPRYALTAVGAPMPMLHVAQEIEEDALSAGATAEPSEAAPLCSFRIAGGAPGAKVSWEVKAVRNDRWVQQRGAPVEVEKHDLERGTYQHPELYGQPPEKGMNSDAEQERPSPAAPLEAAPR